MIRLENTYRLINYRTLMFITGIFFYSCSAIKMCKYSHPHSRKLTVLPYKVFNHSNQAITLKVNDYSTRILDVSGDGIDTSVILNPNESFIVGTAFSTEARSNINGRKRLFKESPGIHNFSVFMNDSMIHIDLGNENWKLKKRCAVFEITDEIF